MSTLLELIGKVLVTGGAFFLVIGAIGMVRLPDFYSRTHAATKPDTLGIIMTMIGLALLVGPSTSSAKLLLIVLFVAVANPAAAHALGRAAVRAGLQPWTEETSPMRPVSTEQEESES